MAQWKYRDYQLDGAVWIYNTLQSYGLAYLAWQERTGKTGTAIKACEDTKLKTVLVLTKKKAIPDWITAIKNFGAIKSYEVLNYESVHKISSIPDIVILDEAHHGLAKYPKPSKTWEKVKALTEGKPIIYLSATPHPESIVQLYYQFALSDWTPFGAWPTFYQWHEVWGEPYLEYIGSRQVKKYDKAKEELILQNVHHLFSRRTRKEAGFEHEPNDVIHFVKLNDDTLAKYEKLSKTMVLEVGSLEVISETVGSLLQKLAQLVGGTMKVEDIENSTEDKMAYKSFFLGNTEKIDYIKSKWGDHDKMVIMYHYKAEEHLLKRHFKHARILQADTWAEGISLKDYDPLIIYSMSWRTSKYIQRRARQADKDRDSVINVHYVLTDDKVDAYIYEAVAVKHSNFNVRYFYG